MLAYYALGKGLEFNLWDFNKQTGSIPDSQGAHCLVGRTDR